MDVISTDIAIVGAGGADVRAAIAAAAHNPLGKLTLLGIVALSAWHAAHRLRMTAHDLGLGGGIDVKATCYGSAGVLILVALAALLAI